MRLYALVRLSRQSQRLGNAVAPVTDVESHLAGAVERYRRQIDLG